LKAEKADKAAVQPHVQSLLALKAKFESITGEPYDVPKAGAKDKSKNKQQQQKPAAASQTQVRQPFVVLCGSILK
jgi:WHEP-TRS domain